MRRAAEKTCGPSPESQHSKKGKEPALSRNNSHLSISNTSNDGLDDSETLFVPHGKEHAKSQGATSANSATSKPRLGKRTVKYHNMDDTNAAPVASKGGPPNKRAKTTELASSKKKPPTAPKLTTKAPKSTSIGSRSAPRPQSKGSVVESSGSRSGHLSTPHTSDSSYANVAGDLLYSNFSSEIQYTDRRDFKWGFQIPGDVQRHKWFKLLLDPDSSNIDIGQANQSNDRQAAPPGYDLEPEDLVEDYLTNLRKALRSCTSNFSSFEYILETERVCYYSAGDVAPSSRSAHKGMC
ncbi:MAG: hypothetical protein Q9204_000054 [Flavoplaca sp. TL-2023a]